MPRYFFDIHDGFESRDDDGRELTDHHAARQEALKVVNELSASEGESKDGYTIVVNVRDKTGDNVLTVRTVCQIDDRAIPRLRIAS